jgi:hypothetical protein
MSETFAAELDACSIDPASLATLGEVASVDIEPVAATVFGSWARAVTTSRARVTSG